MKLPEFLRFNGSGMASPHADISFTLQQDGFGIVLRDQYGERVEPITDPKTLEWMVGVLNASLKWGHTRTASHGLKQEATGRLQRALAGEA